MPRTGSVVSNLGPDQDSTITNCSLQDYFLLDAACVNVKLKIIGLAYGELSIMDNALTAVEKEVYNLSLKIAQLETPDEFARTRAKLEVSAEFVNVNFATSDRTKALDASIGTLLRTLTVLEAKNLKNVQGSSRLERPNQVCLLMPF